ncbi:MAG: hypothetical protein K2Q26_14180 [Bdellovibrionales bacterium]|nr:hypothetical protein [Bdellovibrionales bacterium]
MDTVLQIARHVLQFQPNKDAARLCFYHFLVHHCEPNQKIDAKLIDRFNRFALGFEHWRTNRQQLVQEVQYFLHHFAETYQVNLGFKNLVMPDRWQVLAIDNPIDTLKVLENYYGHGNNVRILPAGDKSFVVLQTDEQKNLHVSSLNNWMILNQHGILEPLNPYVTIHYDSQLNLQAQTIQNVEVAPNSVARFAILGEGMHGHQVRGYTFQKTEEFRGGPVSAYAKVYYAIKRLEQHYIDRRSDPMYVELTQILEKAIELVNMRHPEAISFGEAALERGELAKDAIFPDDNMIRLLTQTLKSSIQSAKNVIPRTLDAAKEVASERVRELSWTKNPPIIE